MKRSRGLEYRVERGRRGLTVLSVNNSCRFGFSSALFVATLRDKRMAPRKASDAFSFGKCCCYALMVMTSPWRLTWATLTCLTASTVLRRFRSIKGTRSWFVKAMDLAFYLCWCHALYHSQLVVICWRCMIWIHWCMWRLFSLDPPENMPVLGTCHVHQKPLFCTAFGANAFQVFP